MRGTAILKTVVRQSAEERCGARRFRASESQWAAAAGLRAARRPPRRRRAANGGRRADRAQQTIRTLHQTARKCCTKMGSLVAAAAAFLRALLTVRATPAKSPLKASSTRRPSMRSRCQVPSARCDCMNDCGARPSRRMKAPYVCGGRKSSRDLGLYGWGEFCVTVRIATQHCRRAAAKALAAQHKRAAESPLTRAPPRVRPRSPRARLSSAPRRRPRSPFPCRCAR